MPLMDTTRGRIELFSRVAKIVIVVPLIGLPVFLSGVWLIFDRIPPSFIVQWYNVSDYTIGPVTKPVGFTASILQSVVAVMLFLNVFRLFSYYEQGIILTASDVRCFKEIGRWLLVLAVNNLIINRLYTLILVMYNTPEQQLIPLGLTSNEVLLFFICFFVMVIGLVLDEARSASDELTLVI